MFSSPLKAGGSHEIWLVDHSGKVLDSERKPRNNLDPFLLDLKVRKALGTGRYVVHWKADANDGFKTVGSLAFYVSTLPGEEQREQDAVVTEVIEFTGSFAAEEGSSRTALATGLGAGLMAGGLLLLLIKWRKTGWREDEGDSSDQVEEP